MTHSAWLKPCLWAAILVLLVCGLPAWGQGQTAASSAPVAAPTPPPLAADAPIPVSGPSADDQAAGDPSGTKTGTANDVVHADPAKPLTLADVVNQAGQNRIAINFTWTLVAGFLVRRLLVSSLLLRRLLPSVGLFLVGRRRLILRLFYRFWLLDGRLGRRGRSRIRKRGSRWLRWRGIRDGRLRYAGAGVRRGRVILCQAGNAAEHHH